MGRSREREQEIFRSVVYGSISFKPMRPPRKNALTVAQGAIKNGRPTVLPRVSVQPNIVETDFFEKAKKHLNRKELAADRPSATRVRHTPHMEFLKCLHLFGVGVLNKDELMLLLRGLFMQGHAPKSGINVGGGASNPAIATDAQELLKDLDEVSTLAILFIFKSVAASSILAFFIQKNSVPHLCSFLLRFWSLEVPTRSNSPL